MTLGDRCDEIVRLIDETLLSIGTDAAIEPESASVRTIAITTSSHPSGSARRERARLELVQPLEPVATTSAPTARLVVQRRRPRRPPTLV